MAEPSRRRYFGTDGIRGKVGESAINAEFFLKLLEEYSEEMIYSLKVP